MGIKFSEDIVPLSVLKVNPGKVVSHVAETHRPILLTSRGAGLRLCRRSKTMRKRANSVRLCKVL